MRLSLKSGTPHSEIGFPGKLIFCHNRILRDGKQKGEKQIRNGKYCFIQVRFLNTFPSWLRVNKKIKFGNLQDIQGSEL